jgi:hypothetical protein
MKIEQALATKIQMGGKGSLSTRLMPIPPEQRVGDRVELAMSKSTLDALPDVRMDRLEAVRKRVANGFYDKPEVREHIADSFLKHSFV